jgi:hypothetical protein
MPLDTHHPYPNPYPYSLGRVWIARFNVDMGRVCEGNTHFNRYPRCLPAAAEDKYKGNLNKYNVDIYDTYHVLHRLVTKFELRAQLVRGAKRKNKSQ